MTEQTRHLLIVEDEAPLRQAIAEQLVDHGYLVEQAESGEAAVARLADFAFDIIITDLRLPGIDGSSVVEAAVGRYPDIVAIIITGYGTFKDAVNAIKRGAHDFVSKPFQIDALLHVLDSALEQRRLQSADGPALSTARNSRGDEQHDSDHRRDRQRQGSRRARHSSAQPTAH